MKSSKKDYATWAAVILIIWAVLMLFRFHLPSLYDFFIFPLWLGGGVGLGMYIAYEIYRALYKHIKKTPKPYTKKITSFSFLGILGLIFLVGLPVVFVLGWLSLGGVPTLFGIAMTVIIGFFFFVFFVWIADRIQKLIKKK